MSNIFGKLDWDKMDDETYKEWQRIPRKSKKTRAH